MFTTTYEEVFANIKNNTDDENLAKILTDLLGTLRDEGKTIDEAIQYIKENLEKGK